MKQILYILIIGMFSTPNIGHAQKVSIKLADKKFQKFAFVDAAELYQFAYKKDSANTYVVRQLIECFHNVGDYKNENHYYDELIESGDYKNEDLYGYYRVLKSNGKYREAEKWLEKYKQSAPVHKHFNETDSLFAFAQNLKTDSLDYRLQPVNINSTKSDMAPAFMGGKLVFSSARDSSKIIRRNYNWDNSPFLELFVADIEKEGQLGHPERLSKKIGSRFHEGGVAFTSNINEIYFTRNNLRRGRKELSDSRALNLGIYRAEVGERGWEVNGEFPFNNAEYSVAHPSLADSVIYFVSDMPGGFGGSDIYRCFRDDSDTSGWSAPENLGPDINTRENEMFPYIASDGMLFFASEGHQGLGGLDIFAATPSIDGFETVENMGYPLNSSRDDFGFIVDKTGRKGYFSTNRKNLASNDDLYFVYLEKVSVYIKGTVRDEESRIELPASLVYLIDSDGDTLTSQLADEIGGFRFDADKGKDYTLLARHEDFFPGRAEVSTRGKLMNSTVIQDILLAAQPQPLKFEGDLAIMGLEAIHYDYDKYNIRPDAAEILDQLVMFLNEHPELEIRLESHTDCRGAKRYNMKLSNRRAASAYQYLVNAGIDTLRMTTEGFGETQILNRCEDGIPCEEPEHAINRRTMIKVVKEMEN